MTAPATLPCRCPSSPLRRWGPITIRLALCSRAVSTMPRQVGEASTAMLLARNPASSASDAPWQQQHSNDISRPRGHPAQQTIKTGVGCSRHWCQHIQPQPHEHIRHSDDLEVPKGKRGSAPNPVTSKSSRRSGVGDRGLRNTTSRTGRPADQGVTLRGGRVAV